MSDNNFLCRGCLSVMCSDCKEIAEEYAELLGMRNREIQQLTHKLEEIEQKLASEKRSREGYERIAKIGLPEVIVQWIDSQVKPKPEGEGSEDVLYKTADSLMRYYAENGSEAFRRQFGSLDILGPCKKILAEGEGKPHPWE